jgi:hypothetical protein
MKQRLHSFVTEEGLQIDESNGQWAIADFPKKSHFEPGSNVTVVEDLHTQKHNSQNFSTDAGMQIDESDEQFAKTPEPRQGSLEPDSNVSVERTQQKWKQKGCSFSTERGMQMDESDEESNAQAGIHESLDPDSFFFPDLLP